MEREVRSVVLFARRVTDLWCRVLWLCCGCVVGVGDGWDDCRTGGGKVGFEEGWGEFEEQQRFSGAEAWGEEVWE